MKRMGGANVFLHDHSEELVDAPVASRLEQRADPQLHLLPVNPIPRRNIRKHVVALRQLEYERKDLLLTPLSLRYVVIVELPRLQVQTDLRRRHLLRVLSRDRRKHHSPTELLRLPRRRLPLRV